MPVAENCGSADGGELWTTLWGFSPDRCQVALLQQRSVWAPGLGVFRGTYVDARAALKLALHTSDPTTFVEPSQ